MDLVSYLLFLCMVAGTMVRAASEEAQSELTDKADENNNTSVRDRINPGTIYQSMSPPGGYQDYNPLQYPQGNGFGTFFPSGCSCPCTVGNTYPQQYPQQFPQQYPQQYPQQFPQQFPQQYPQQFRPQYPSFPYPYFGSTSFPNNMYPQGQDNRPVSDSAPSRTEDVEISAELDA